MASFTSELQAVLVLLLVFAIPFVVAVLWRLYKKRVQRREVAAMRRGNKIYSEWRGATTNRQPLE